MTCLHCQERPALEDNPLCEVCTAYPRCRGCEVIFGEGLSKPSKDDATKCDSCVGFETFIDFYCVGCGRSIALFYSPTTSVLRYTVRGNWCSHCNSTATIASRQARVKDEPEALVGYLKIMADAVRNGSVSQFALDEAIELNPHDVA